MHTRLNKLTQTAVGLNSSCNYGLIQTWFETNPQAKAHIFYNTLVAHLLPHSGHNHFRKLAQKTACTSALQQNHTSRCVLFLKYAKQTALGEQLVQQSTDLALLLPPCVHGIITVGWGCQELLVALGVFCAASSGASWTSAASSVESSHTGQGWHPTASLEHHLEEHGSAGCPNHWA